MDGTRSRAGQAGTPGRPIEGHHPAQRRRAVSFDRNTRKELPAAPRLTPLTGAGGCFGATFVTCRLPGQGVGDRLLHQGQRRPLPSPCARCIRRCPRGADPSCIAPSFLTKLGNAAPRGRGRVRREQSRRRCRNLDDAAQRPAPGGAGPRSRHSRAVLQRAGGSAGPDIVCVVPRSAEGWPGAARGDGAAVRRRHARKRDPWTRR